MLFNFCDKKLREIVSLGTKKPNPLQINEIGL